MDSRELQKKAKDLSRRISRFQLTQLKQKAEQGKNELTGLSRFEMGELTSLYEKERLESGYQS